MWGGGESKYDWMVKEMVDFMDWAEISETFPSSK